MKIGIKRIPRKNQQKRIKNLVRTTSYLSIIRNVIYAKSTVRSFTCDDKCHTMRIKYITWSWNMLQAWKYAEEKRKQTQKSDAKNVPNFICTIVYFTFLSLARSFSHCFACLPCRPNSAVLLKHSIDSSMKMRRFSTSLNDILWQVKWIRNVLVCEMNCSACVCLCHGVPASTVIWTMIRSCANSTVIDYDVMYRKNNG